jgi:hypothetical protein
MDKIDQLANRRQFLKTSIVAAAGLGCLRFGATAQPFTSGFQDAKNTHNMMVVGTKTVYISHLPMFDAVNTEGTDFTSPHRRQVILEATFTRNGRDLTIALHTRSFEQSY